MDMKCTEPPMALLKMIGFDLLAPNEIIESSTFGIHDSTRGSKSLCDPRLGLPNNEDKCGTCQLVNNSEHLCPGHFGHFTLALPIFNPQHVHVLARILNLVCPSCGNRKAKQEKKVHQTGTPHEVRKELKEGDCKHCKHVLENCYPDLRFKVVTRKVQDLEVEAIEMHVLEKRGTQFPADFWSFLDRSIDVMDSPRLSRPLLPAEAIKLLEKVPDSILRKIGFALRPTCLIIKNFCIPPNCLRFMDGFKDGYSVRRLELNQKTRSLLSILSMNKSLKRTYDDLYSAHKDTLDMQARFAMYFKAFKTFSSEKEQPVQKRKAARGKTYTQAAQKSGQTWFKMNILGKRSHFSSLGVLSGAPDLSLQQLAIPRIVAQNLKVSERITSHNLESVQGRVHDCPSKYFVTRDNEKRRMPSGPRPLNLQIGDVIERPLMDGDFVFSNRLPTLHKHSFLGFKAKIEDRHTFGINPILCGPLSGDFDGDMLHVYAPQSLEARVEVPELLDVSHQMISSQGGQALLKLSQDGILSSYLILQRHFWLSRNEIQSLNMYCESSVPRPAIVKAPGITTPLWTGLQVLSMTLPPHVDYTYSRDVFVCDSEILHCTVDNKWLTDSHKGILTSLCYQLGSQKALDFLTILHNVLREWLSQTGFSVGLNDMYLTDNRKWRKKLVAEVQIALEDAKNSSKVAMELVRQIQSVLLGRGEVSPSGFIGSCDADQFVCQDKLVSLASTKSVEETQIREFQGVFGEIETTIKRHSSPFNSMMAMIQAGSKGSLSNLVQQCGCLGLQLSNGERWLFSKKSVNEEFCEYAGIIHACFVDGLNSMEFLSHLISCRKPGKGFGAEGPGELFRKCMFGLRELYSAYDGSVRTRTDNHIIQLVYEDFKDDDYENNFKSMKSVSECVGPESVGALAVTALIEPAYNYTFDQSRPEKVNPIELLKETLLRGSITGCKGADFKSILAISSNTKRRKTDLARTALQIQNHLQCCTLRMLPLKTMIEFNLQKTNSEKLMPWIIHIHVSQIALKRADIKVSDILALYFDSHSKETREKSISSDCINCEKNEACINISFDLSNGPEVGEESSFGNSFLDHLNFLKHSVLPLLLKTVIKGSSKIMSASVQWKDFVPWSHLFNKDIAHATDENQDLGELFVEVSTSTMPRRGQAWEVIKESCSQIMDCIDWSRSRPYSIPEVFISLGIEAARAVIYEKLQQCAHELGRKVRSQHLSLISDYMTHSGQVLPFNASGFKEWNKVMDISAPFTEGAFQNPRATYFDAARRRKTERLSGMLSSLIWGRYDTVGENSPFELIWSPKSQDNLRIEGRPYNFIGTDILELLSKRGASRGNSQDSKFSDVKDLMQQNDDYTDLFPKYPPGFEHHDSRNKESSSSSTLERSQLAFSLQRILHHRYNDDEELSQEDMQFLVQKVLINHPNSKDKIGCGVAGIKIGHSLEHPESRCFVICRKDGTFEDFSYHKCLRNIP